VSELLVVGFPDTHRAAQVAYELQRIDPRWTSELALAVTIAWQDDGRLLIHQTVDPAAHESAAWSGLWAALIREALLVPNTDRLPAASRAAQAALAGGEAGPAPAPPSLPPSWWVERLGIPEEFMRDIGALVEPGHSAMFLYPHALDPTRATQVLRRFGGTVLRCPLDEAQDARIQAVLAADAR
jgi:uncharacterized membrane protein